MTETQFTTVNVDEKGYDQIASGLTGFSDEAEDLLRKQMMTTIFIAGSSAQSQGRSSYMLGEDGSRIWLPNSLRCWITDLTVVTQTYQEFDPVDKLLVSVTASDGCNYVYRCGLNSWTASSFLTCLKAMTRQQHAEQVQVTLNSKGRATFVAISCIGKDLSTFERVAIPKEDLGRKLAYDECLDVITYVNKQAQVNPESETVAEQIDSEDMSFDVSDSELDELLDEIKSEQKSAVPKRKRRSASTPSTVAEAVATEV